MPVPNLLPHHQKLLDDSAISPGVAAARGYRTVVKASELADLGFSRSQQSVPGLLIPIHGTDGQHATHQFRPDTPRSNKKTGKPIKYETPFKSVARLDVNPLIAAQLKKKGVTKWITEGSRKADAAISAGLVCIGLMGVWMWRNKSGPLVDWDSILLDGETFNVAFDSDVTTKDSVRDALGQLIAFLKGRGAAVNIVLLPDLLGGGKTGLDDYLFAGGSVVDLEGKYLLPARTWIEETGSGVLASGPYEMTPTGTYRVTGSGEDIEREALCNFQCLVKEDIFRTDGVVTVAHRKLEVRKGDMTRETTVPVDQFGLMTWTRALGTGFIIEAGANKKDHLRAAIEKISDHLGVRTVHDYTATGWVRVLGSWHFVGSEAARQAGVQSTLAGPLASYDIPAPPEGDALRSAIRVALELWDVAPDAISVPLFSAVFRAPVGAAPLAIFLVGSTGVFKTEIAALMQRFYGKGMDAQHLPGSWSSTANALEELAFLAKDALMVVDDFVLTGTQKDVSGMQARAERLLRASGNGSGRIRMQADTNLRGQRPPRGLLISTGEDLPAGHSLRARIIALEVGKGDVHPHLLTSAQTHAANGLYAGVFAAFLQFLAPRLDEARSRIDILKKAFRESMTDAAHARTPDAIADLAVGVLLFLEFAASCAAISPQEHETYSKRAVHACREVARAQLAQIRDANPVDRLGDLLRQTLAARRAHICDLEGCAPVGARAAFGWSLEGPYGDKIGWTDGKHVYLLPSVALQAVRNTAGQTEPFNATDRGLGKQLKQRNLLVATDSARSTSTVRKVIDGVRQKVWVLPYSWVFPSETDQSDHSGHPSSNEVQNADGAGQIRLWSAAETDQQADHGEVESA